MKIGQIWWGYNIAYGDFYREVIGVFPGLFGTTKRRPFLILEIINSEFAVVCYSTSKKNTFSQYLQKYTNINGENFNFLPNNAFIILLKNLKQYHGDISKIPRFKLLKKLAMKKFFDRAERTNVYKIIKKNEYLCFSKKKRKNLILKYQFDHQEVINSKNSKLVIERRALLLKRKMFLLKIK